MKVVKRTLLAAALALAGIAGPALAQQGVTDTEIVVGDILPLSGPPALLGVAHNLGVKVAVAEVNAAGGINGRKLRLISEDDGYVIARTLQGLRKLINNDKVFALTSLSGSTQGQAALSIIKASGVPTITTISFAEDAYKPVVKNLFAIGTLHPIVTSEVTKELNTLYPNKKWAIISQDDEYGQLTRQGFEEAAKELKLQVVSNSIYKKGQVDFSAEILKAKQAGAEMLFAGGLISENVAMAKELERQGMKVPMGVSYVARIPALLKLMGSAGSSVYTADYVESEESARGKAFLTMAKSHLTADEFARTNRFTMSGYMGAKVLFEAMRRCGKALTQECTISQLEQMKDFDTGVSSPVNFSPTQHLSLQQLHLLKGNPTTLAFDPVK